MVGGKEKHKDALKDTKLAANDQTHKANKRSGSQL